MSSVNDEKNSLTDFPVRKLILYRAAQRLMTISENAAWPGECATSPINKVASSVGQSTEFLFPRPFWQTAVPLIQETAKHFYLSILRSTISFTADEKFSNAYNERNFLPSDLLLLCVQCMKTEIRCAQCAPDEREEWRVYIGDYLP